MKKRWMRYYAPWLLGLLLCGAYTPLSWADECVILLHGLARSASSMDELATKLTARGYYVANIDYPSREKPISELSAIAVSAGLEACAHHQATPVNFVTHSLGGILVRHYYQQRSTAEVKRVVMLGPPNHGSEVVDNLKELPGYELLNGPAGMELGTGEDALPNRLGGVRFDLGVIAGTQSINPILSSFLPNPNDGKVSVESTRVEGMCGFVALPVTHTFLMRNHQVIAEVIHYLETGRFASPLAEEALPGCEIR